MLAGSTGLLAVLVAWQGQSFRGAASSWLLTTADKLGLIRQPTEGSLDEAKAPSLLSFTDETALSTMQSVGVVLGIAAILLAVWASSRRECNLYFAAGLVCGGLCLTVAHYVLGLGSLLLGSALVLATKRAG